MPGMQEHVETVSSRSPLEGESTRPAPPAMEIDPGVQQRWIPLERLSTETLSTAPTPPAGPQPSGYKCEPK